MTLIATPGHELAAACGQEGAGLVEALMLAVVLAILLLLALIAFAAVLGARRARRQGRPERRGALQGGGIALAGLAAIGALVVAVWWIDEAMEQREYRRVEAWLQPLATASPGTLGATLDQLVKSAPTYGYAADRLGYQLRQILVGRDVAWTDDDLRRALGHAPAPGDLRGAVAWARHGLAGLDRALVEVGHGDGAKQDLALLVHTASWRCSADLVRCRGLTRDEVFQQMEDAVAARWPGHEGRHLVDLVRNVRHQAFPPQVER